MLRKKEVIGVLLTLAIISPLSASAGGFEKIYLVGDSLSDQGNLYYATKYFAGWGIPADDHYWDGRFANGEIWAGVLATRLNIDLTPSLFRNGSLDYSCTIDAADCGSNFAVGGARTDYNRVEDDWTKPMPVPYLGHGGLLPEDAFPWTVNTQAAAFAARGPTGPDSLYVTFAGTNDLSDLITMAALCHSGHTVFCSERGDPANAIPVILGGINNAISAFVAAGARDILVPNMPNLGVIPAITPYGPDFVALATGLSTAYNQGLDTILAQWESAGVNIIRFDAFSLLTNVVAHPQAFGFSNAAQPCYEGFVAPNPTAQECADPEAYVFWDIEHPTAAFHAFLADRVLAAITLDILGDLDRQVSGLDVNKGVKTSLNDKLGNAIRALSDENSANDGVATKMLREFLQIVNARQGKHIPNDMAIALIARAEQIVSLLDA